MHGHGIDVACLVIVEENRSKKSNNVVTGQCYVPVGVLLLEQI